MSMPIFANPTTTNITTVHCPPTHELTKRYLLDELAQLGPPDAGVNMDEAVVLAADSVRLDDGAVRLKQLPQLLGKWNGRF